MHPRKSRGTAHYNAKLTDQAVRHIRKSSESLGELAALFNCSRSTVHGIRKGTAWRHVK